MTTTASCGICQGRDRGRSGTLGEWQIPVTLPSTRQLSQPFRWSGRSTRTDCEIGPRLKVKAYDAVTIPDGGHLFAIRVSNRGRRPATITNISRASDPFKPEHSLLRAPKPRLPHRLDESESVNFAVGPGVIPKDRWYVVDGGGRIHPLHERYRQRAEAGAVRVMHWLRILRRSRP